MLPQHLTQVMFAKYNLPATGKRIPSLSESNYLVRAYQMADIVAVLLSLFTLIPLKSQVSGISGVLTRSVTVRSLLLLLASLALSLREIQVSIEALELQVADLDTYDAPVAP